MQITQETCDMKTDLRLANDEDGLIRCNERIQGYTPIFISRESALARRIIEHCQCTNLAWGSGGNHKQSATKVLDSKTEIHG